MLALHLCLTSFYMANNGYYVMTYGSGRYTSIAWYKTEEDAQELVNSLLARGSWCGMPPKIQEAGHGKA